MIEYEVTAKDLHKRLASLDQYPEIAGRHSRRAMSDSVKALSRVARSVAPQGATGELRAGIDHEMWMASDQTLAGRVVDRTFYALWVEFGTVRMRGRHFLYRAYVQTQRAILQAFTEAMRRIFAELGGNRAAG